MDSKGTRDGLFFMGLFLAAAIVFAAWTTSDTILQVKAQENTIKVKGVAEKIVRADKGVWYATVRTRGDDLKSTYAALTRDMDKVLDFLKQTGVPESWTGTSPVRTMSLKVYDRQGRPTGKIAGYEMEQEVRVGSNKVEAIQGIAKKSSRIISQGVDLMARQPEYFCSDLTSVKNELIGAATLNARERAEQFASGSGLKVGRLNSARQGVFQITPPDSVDVAGYGMYDTSTINKKVRSVVTVEFTMTQ
jgi:hypothetical protein